MNTHGADGEGEGGAEEGEVEGGGDVRGGENLLGHSRHDLGGARLGGGHHGTWGGKGGRGMGWVRDRRERGGYRERARVGRDRAAGAAGDRLGRAIVDLGGAGVRNSRATARTGARIALGADGLAARRGRRRADRERDRRDDEGRTRTHGERDGRHLLGDLDGADGSLGGHLHGAGGASLGGAGRGGNLDGGDGGNLGDGHFEVGVVLMCYETCVRMARVATLPASSSIGSWFGQVATADNVASGFLTSPHTNQRCILIGRDFKWPAV